MRPAHPSWPLDALVRSLFPLHGARGKIIGFRNVVCCWGGEMEDVGPGPGSPPGDNPGPRRKNFVSCRLGDRDESWRRTQQIHQGGRPPPLLTPSAPLPWNVSTNARPLSPLKLLFLYSLKVNPTPNELSLFLIDPRSICLEIKGNYICLCVFFPLKKKYLNKMLLSSFNIWYEVFFTRVFGHHMCVEELFWFTAQ